MSENKKETYANWECPGCGTDVTVTSSEAWDCIVCGTEMVPKHEIEKESVKVLNISRRVGASSPNGCVYAIDYEIEGEKDNRMMWADEFFEEHTDIEVSLNNG